MVVRGVAVVSISVVLASFAGCLGEPNDGDPDTGASTTTSPASQIEQPDSPATISSLSTLPGPRYALASVWGNGAGYLFGGYDGSRVDQVVRFDPLTGRSEVVDRLPVAASDMTAAWANGRAYVFGGFIENKDGIYATSDLASVLIYEPDLREFTAGSPLPSGRESAAAALVGQQVFLFGGYQESGRRLDEIVRYDLTTNVVSVMPTHLPEPMTTSAAAVGGSVYLFGGGNAQTRDTIYRYTPATDSLQVMNARLPAPASGIMAVSDGTLIYLLGGRTDAPSSTILIYDPEADAVSVAGVRLPVGTQQGGVAWSGTSAYVFGGYVEGPSPISKQVIRFDP